MASVRKGFPDRVFERANQTELPQGHDANSKSEDLAV